MLKDCKKDDEIEIACLTLLWSVSKVYSGDELNLAVRDHVASVMDTHATAPS